MEHDLASVALSIDEVTTLGAAYGGGVLVRADGASSSHLCTALPDTFGPPAPELAVRCALPFPDDGAALRVRGFSVRPLPNDPSEIPPPATAVWLRVVLGGAGDRSETILRHRALATLNGRLVCAGCDVDFGTDPGDRVEVVRVAPAGVARVTAKAEFHLERALASVAASAAASSDVGDGIFDGQRHAHAALQAMVRAATGQAEKLRSWGVTPPAGLLLFGPPGTGKTHLVRTVARRAGLPLVVVPGGAAGGASRLREAFARAEHEARGAATAGGRAGAVVFLDEVDALCPKRDGYGASQEQALAVTQLLTLLDGIHPRRGVLVVAATNRPHDIDPALRRPGRFEWEVPLGLPQAKERRQTLERCCERIPRADDVDLDEVASLTSGCSSADLIAIAREAALTAAARVAAAEDAAGVSGNAVVSMADFVAALKVAPASVGRGHVMPVEAVAWSEIGGLDEVKRQLRRAVEWPLNHAEAFGRLGISPPTGVLLHGPPGCSKTTLARAAAGAAGATFLYLSGAQVYSPFVGEAERALRDFFTLGRSCAPSILFLDELEALVGKRAFGDGGGGGGGESGDGVQLRVLSTLLNELDGVEKLGKVLLIGATNRPDMLDAALLRPGRFDVQLLVPPPDEAGRLEVLKVHARKSPLAADVDLADLAARTDGWSGALLAGLCREAAMEALRESLGAGEVRAAHFEAALPKVHGHALPTTEGELAKRLEGLGVESE